MAEEILNPEIIEGQDPVVEGQVAEEGAAQAAETQESAEPVRQTRRENSQFAAARHEAEAQAREAQRLADEQKSINARLVSAIKGFGYNTDDPSEIADLLEAQSRSVTVEQVRAERQALETRARQLKENDPEVLQMKAQLEQYRQNEMERHFQDDLKAIKKQHPGEKAKSIMDLGEAFISARSVGVDTLAAYDIAMAAKGRTEPPKPPETPSINKSTGKEKEFYTSAEVDKLTPEDLSNPRIMAAVQHSMPKW